MTMIGIDFGTSRARALPCTSPACCPPETHMLWFSHVKTRLLVTLAFATFLAFMAPRLWAQDGVEGVLPRVVLVSQLNPDALFEQGLAVADFDNDHKPDGAVLVQSGKTAAGQNSFRIELHLSNSANTALTFESNETTLAITAVDVNKDGATDLVVEQPLTHKRLYVWLGDGHGGFHKGRVEDFSSYCTFKQSVWLACSKVRRTGNLSCSAAWNGQFQTDSSGLRRSSASIARLRSGLSELFPNFALPFAPFIASTSPRYSQLSRFSLTPGTV